MVSGFQQVSNESREYEDLMNIVTSGYLDASSAACFSYSSARLINNELLEKEVTDGWLRWAPSLPPTAQSNPQGFVLQLVPVQDPR